jgi:hypothetical protein
MVGELLSEFLTIDELARELKRKPETLKFWRKRRTGPPVTKLGKQVLYRRASVIAWIAACELKPPPAGGRRVVGRRR